MANPFGGPGGPSPYPGTGATPTVPNPYGNQRPTPAVAALDDDLGSLLNDPNFRRWLRHAYERYQAEQAEGGTWRPMPEIGQSTPPGGYR